MVDVVVTVREYFAGQDVDARRVRLALSSASKGFGDSRSATKFRSRRVHLRTGSFSTTMQILVESQQHLQSTAQLLCFGELLPFEVISEVLIKKLLMTV